MGWRDWCTKPLTLTVDVCARLLSMLVSFNHEALRVEMLEKLEIKVGAGRKSRNSMREKIFLIELLQSLISWQNATVSQLYGWQIRKHSWVVFRHKIWNLKKKKKFICFPIIRSKLNVFLYFGLRSDLRYSCKANDIPVSLNCILCLMQMSKY